MSRACLPVVTKVLTGQIWRSITKTSTQTFKTSPLASSDDKDQTLFFESLYPVANIKELPIIVQEKMYALQDKAGFIPNLLQALAHRPEYLTAFLECYDTVTGRADSSITNAERELIGLVVSSCNNCQYGIVAHSSLLRRFSDYSFQPNAKSVLKLVKSDKLSPRHKLLADVTFSVAQAHSISDEQVLELEKHHLSHADIWDVVAFASLVSMINRMSLFLHICPNPEFYHQK